uniref:RNA-directed DNA polymerase n=1 Tax=Trichuris muris TaxID=70415 RepID=A0A5S6QCG8_TRIMR
MSPRMIRWSIMLSAYDYNLVYRPGKEHGNADASSRLPQPDNVAEVPDPLEVLLLESMPDPPIMAKQIADLSDQDPILYRVRNWLIEGWPSKIYSNELKTFWCRRNELSIHKNCVLWGCRVVVPAKLQQLILRQLRCGHPGIVRMKCLVRSFVWWPKMDLEIEASVRSCVQCQESSREPPRLQTNHWPPPNAPCARVHVDIFGPLQGKVFFIAVDSFPKWLEVRIVSSTSSRAAIEVLKELFGTHGLPDCLVTDSGTAFISDFSEFMKSNHTRHLKTTPFHPS